MGDDLDEQSARRARKSLVAITPFTRNAFVCHVQKDSVSDASRLLDLGGLAVDRIESDTFGGRVVHLVTADETASACPSCGVFSDSVKGLVCTRPRDIPYGTRALRLIWHKRRWRCKERLCARSSFTVRSRG